MSETRPQATASMVGEVLGSYRVISELSTGGMGTVYRAQHELLGRSAAVKLLRPELTANEELLQRFFNEAKAATAIRHPGIVEVYDFGYTDDGRAYIVMELLDGEPLGERIRRCGRLSETETEGIGRQIAGSLRAAHAKGIVHRDLKPDNVFLVPDADGHGDRVKVLDFGIAKLLDVSPTSVRHTQTGVLMGTPLYMAPEQARAAGQIDHRADLYSLGCILYEMLVGQPPFVADGAGEIIALQLFAAPEPPSKRLTELHPELERIVMRLLEKEPEARYQHAVEVHDVLHALRDTLSRRLAGEVAGGANRFAMSMSQANTEPATSQPRPTPVTSPILPTPLPSVDQSLRLSLLDGPPGLPEQRSSSAMPIIAAVVTLLIAGAVGIFVMSRDAGAPSEPVPIAPRPPPVVEPAPSSSAPGPVEAAGSVAKAPAVIEVVDEPPATRPKSAPRKARPATAGTPGPVTSPAKDERPVTDLGSPIETTIGEPSKPRPTDSPTP